MLRNQRSAMRLASSGTEPGTGVSAVPEWLMSLGSLSSGSAQPMRSATTESRPPDTAATALHSRSPIAFEVP